MKRTEVTYGQLDRVLRALGFTCRLIEGSPPARWYEHKENGELVGMEMLNASTRTDNPRSLDFAVLAAS